MGEFVMNDNLYHLWQHVWLMNVFDHHPKVISFPIRDHLVALMLGGQGISKVSNFPLWIYTLLDRLERVLKALVLFYSSSDAILRSMAGLNNNFIPMVKPNMKFYIRARKLVVHRCEIFKSVWWFHFDRCSKYLI